MRKAKIKLKLTLDYKNLNQKFFCSIIAEKREIIVMKEKLVPLIILLMFAIGTWWMIQSMDNLAKATQPTVKTQPK